MIQTSREMMVMVAGTDIHRMHGSTRPYDILLQPMLSSIMIHLDIEINSKQAEKEEK